MLTHKAIWAAIDGLADRYGLTASGLARKAGLDPTTFNRSKREAADGRQRWPSTESIAKVIEATGASIGDFMEVLVDASGLRGSAFRIPMLNLAQAGQGGLFDEAGLPLIRSGWERVPFPDVNDDQAYALEVGGDSLMPVYRDGTLLILSPRAPTRRNDRVVLRRLNGEMLCRQLLRKTLTRVELAAFDPAQGERSLDATEIAWMHRIVWASQ
ncbi:helix-turn-helix transcriptional regulator [Ferrovibrio sp.]|uniref:S24 family peptidase n=1 Tax=Ferrovibrio sp. TaxID=1917215 RepID=UPI001B699B14|nr:helix-turn-helix transcriptional regulator [Ferrovibrio sp.]MBP7062744.1 helix-turn-helix transcriptional regulator [Ferrovibrio sp.]